MAYVAAEIQYIDNKTSFIFYILLTVRLIMILGKLPTGLTISFYINLM